MPLHAARDAEQRPTPLAVQGTHELTLAALLAIVDYRLGAHANLARKRSRAFQYLLAAAWSGLIPWTRSPRTATRSARQMSIKCLRSPSVLSFSLETSATTRSGLSG